MKVPRTSMILAVALLLSAAGAGAQDCQNYENFLHWSDFRDIPTGIDRVAVEGDLALAVDGDNRIWTVGLAGAEPLELLGSLAVPGLTLDLAMEGGRAYLANGSDGLRVLDLSDPEIPTTLGTASVDDSARAVCAAAGLVYLADHHAGLKIFDAGDPHYPQLVGSWDSPGCARELCLDGGLLYLADDTRGVQVLDVSDPAAPDSISTIGTSDRAVSVRIRDGILFISQGDGGLDIYDLSQPEAPALVAACPTRGCLEDAIPHGDLLFLVQEGLGLEVLDLGLLAQPEPHAFFEMPNDVVAGEICGDRLLAGLSRTGLLFMDAASPEIADAVAHAEPFAADLRDIKIHGDILYSAAGPGEVRFYDLGDPLNPLYLATLAVTGAPATDVTDVAVHDGHAYLSTTGASRVEIHDIGDIQHPSLVASLSPAVLTTSIAVGGDRLFLGTENRAGDLPDGLLIYDVSDPAAPVELPGVPASAWGESPVEQIVVLGDHVYLAARERGIVIIDVSDPDAPFLVDVLDYDIWIYRIPVHEAKAYLCVTGGWLTVMDLADPASPQLEDVLSLDVYFTEAEVLGRHLYLRAYDQVAVLDLLAPGGVGRLSRFLIPDCHPSLLAHEGWLLMASTDSTLITLRPQCGSFTALPEDPAPAEGRIRLGCYPNPFNPEVILEFSLRRAGRVDLEIIDAGGRRVRSLLAGASLDAGVHRLEWKGRDDRGRQLSSGVYLARIATEEGLGSAKLILIE